MDINATLDQTARWLRKANAKAVSVCMLVTLVAVASLWTFRLMTDVRNTGIAATNLERKRQDEPLGVLSMIASVEQKIADCFPSVSPFAGAPANSGRHSNTNEPPQRRPRPSFLENFLPKPIPDKPAINRPETVSIVYKGIFKRSDGVTMALVQDSKSGRSSFYKIDTDIFGMTLHGIKTDTIEIIQENGETIELKLNQSEVFVEGKHAR